MLFPVKFLEKGLSVKDLGLPDGVSYVVAQDGIYKRVKTALFEYLVKVGKEEDVDGIATTVPVEGHHYTTPIQESMLLQIEAFFRLAYEKYAGEAVVLLYFNPTKREWRVHVPEQKVLGLHVSYNSSECPGEMDGFYLASSIHSHASVAAFHSATDDHDEFDFDGLHITIGNVDKPVRTYAARWVFGRTVFKADLDAIFSSKIDKLPDVPEDWMLKVKKHEPVFEINHKQAIFESLNLPSWHELGYKHRNKTDKPDKTFRIDDEINEERNVVGDPFALVYDFEALLEAYER